MSIPKNIVDSIRALPKSKQIEIFDFVEYLKQKAEQAEKEEDITWSNLSIASAMRGMETEEPLYSIGDLTEIYQ